MFIQENLNFRFFSRKRINIVDNDDVLINAKTGKKPLLDSYGSSSNQNTPATQAKKIMDRVQF